MNVMAFALAVAAAIGTQPPTHIPAAPLVVEAILKAPPAEIWRVFSTADGYKKLGVAHCDVDLRVGGLIRSHYDPRGVLGDEGTIQNEILAFEPERMMAFHVKKPPRGFPFAPETYEKTWSVATLTDLGDGRTHLRLTGMGFTDSEDSRKMRAFFEQGNTWVLRKLQQQYDTSTKGPAGPAHSKTSTDAFTHERVLNLPRQDVWDLVSTSRGWKKFLGVESSIELKPGGPFEIYFGNDAPKGERGSEGCTVLSFVPREMLSFTWNAPPKFAHARKQHTFVVVRIDEVSAARTRIRLTHQGFAEQAALHPERREEWESVRAYFDNAWNRVLDQLAAQEPKPAATAAGE